MALHSEIDTNGIVGAFLVLLIGCPLLFLLLDELLKIVQRRRKKRLQKYLRLLFDTRLGMWSPK